MHIEIEKQESDYIREVIVKYRGPKRKSPCFRDSEAVANFLRGVLVDNSREHFIALFLDAGNRVASYSIIAIGGKQSCPVDVTGIFQRALIVGASSIIVSHNHPSGDTKPSEEDRQITKALCEVGKLLRINVLDHIIISDDEHFSFSDSEMIARNTFFNRNSDEVR